MAMLVHKTPIGGDLDDDTLDDPAEPGGRVRPEMSYGLYEIIGRPEESSTATIGRSLVLGDALGGRCHEVRASAWKAMIRGFAMFCG
jgi:hypothetical protein